MTKTIYAAAASTLRRARFALLAFVFLAAAGAAQTASAQCPLPDSNNRAWARGSTVVYYFDGVADPEIRRQVRWAFAEWSRANSVNNARVRFEESTTGGGAFRVTLGTLPPSNPGTVNRVFDQTNTVMSATLTIDPNAVFGTTGRRIFDPSQPGYETAFTKTALHEIGHTMGLEHPTFYPVSCSAPNGATVMNNVCQPNDQLNNIPVQLTSCDQNAVNSLPRYPPFTQSPNPIDAVVSTTDTATVNFFVRQQYLDFLSREPDSGGLNFWAGQINGCGTNTACRDERRSNVSAAFFLSPEFQETGYFVYRVYQAAFGDLPTQPAVPITIREFLPEQQAVGRGFVDGAPNDDAVLETNKQAWLAEFVQRPCSSATSFRCFTARYATVSNETFVDTMRANVGGASVISDAERNSLVQRLNAGQITRAQALREVADDPDLKAAEFRQAFVTLQYFGYLRRDPDNAGYQFWLNKLNDANGDYLRSEMVRSFVVSGEYKARFGAT